MTRASAGNEFSRVFALAQLGDEGAEVEISADADERAALARRFGIGALDALAATVRLNRVEGRAAVRIRASFVADVVQTCVATLEPVASHMEVSVERTFAPGGEACAEVEVAPEDDDGPEPLVGDEIDIGEVVAEHLGLNLDPYPRLPGVVFSAEESVWGDGGSAAPGSPFAKLRRLKSTP